MTKYFEIRDEGTTIPTMASKLDFNDSWLLHRAGFGKDETYIVFVNLNNMGCQYDPSKWTRTMREAHRYIEKHWDELKSDDVIDVQFILGETSTKKVSEKR